MNNLEIFKSEEFGQVRVIERNGEPWFVAKDIASILGYSETNTMTKRLDEDDFISTKMEGMNMKSILLSESGLYSAILGSKLPNAKRFKRWVTSEILPSIRKHGMYAMDELLDNPDLLIATATKLKEERIARIEAEKKALIAENEVKFQKEIVEGLASNISLAEKQARINQIIRTSAGSYAEKYYKLYTEFNRKYHINIYTRHKNAIAKGEIKKNVSKLTYICENLGMLDELYELVVKLFATNVDNLIQEMYCVRGISI